MAILLTLLRKDMANFVRDRTAVSLTFLVPIALIYIFGHVFGLNRKANPGPRSIPLAVVNLSPSPGAARLVAALQGEKAFRVLTTHRFDGVERPLTAADLRPLMRDNAFRFAVVIPEDLVRADGIGLRLQILSNPQNEIETQTVNGLLQKTIFSSVPELLGESLQRQARARIGDARLATFNRDVARSVAQAFGGDAAEVEQAIAAGDFGFGQMAAGRTAAGAAPGGNTNALAGLVDLQTEQVIGRDVKSPEATRVVGGWAVMFLLFALSGSAAAFFDERKTGIFQRLLAGPVRRSDLLWSRFLWGIVLGLVQLTTLFLAGRLLYGIDVFGHFGNLVLVCTAAAAACTAFGMLIAAITPTPAAASGLATFIVLIMSACGGAWFPISFMPEFMQQLSKFTIVYWAMQGFTQVLWAGAPLVKVLPTIGILLGIAAVVMSIAVWRFNRSRLFG